MIKGTDYDDRGSSGQVIILCNHYDKKMAGGAFPVEMMLQMEITMILVMRILIMIK